MAVHAPFADRARGAERPSEKSYPSFETALDHAPHAQAHPDDPQLRFEYDEVADIVLSPQHSVLLSRVLPTALT